MKETNKEFENIVEWVEECSTLNVRTKDLITTLKKNSYLSNKPVVPHTFKNAYLSNFLTSKLPFYVS